MIIDSHVYLLPPRLRDPLVKLPKSEEAIFKAIYRHPEGPYALSLSSPEAISSSMKKSGIDISVLVALPWSGPEFCRENNDFILKLASSNNKFKAVCSVQPRLKGWREEAFRCLKQGALGFKVNASWQGFSLDGKETGELADFVAKKKVLLMVHVDHGFKKSASSAACLYNLAKNYPKTHILAAHLGGLLGLYAMHQPVRQALKNVWFDTAVSSTIKLVEFSIKAGLGSKIIFGSDFPFNHSHKQGQVLRAIRSLKLGSSSEKMIFCNNFLSLIKG